jgi:serine/threonine-protein kinase
MTKTSMSLGSPLYMSPEQMASTRNVDERTDIWALGTILHEMLTCNAPFTGNTLPEICYKIATEPPAPLRMLRPDVPAEIEAVVRKCLEKQRTERYRNVAELAAALVDFGPPRVRVSFERISRTIQNAGGSISAELPPQRVGDPGGTGKQSAGTMAPFSAVTGVKSRAPLAIGLVSALSVVAIGAGALVRTLSRPSPASAAGPAATELAPAATQPAAPIGAAPVETPPPPASAAPTASAARDLVPTEPPPPARKPEPAVAAPARPTPRKVDRPAPPTTAPRSKPADDLGGRF